MTERIVLALDGGQSGTLAVVGTTSGRILGVGAGGPIRHHDEPDAESVAADSVASALDAAYGEAGLVAAAEACCLSMTGSSGIVEAVVAERVHPGRIDVLASDAVAALAAGTGRAVGVVVIAGTGSVAYAASADGSAIDRGGWGWFMGDEGSGFWIAVQALRAAALGFDGVGPATELSELLPAALGFDTLREVYNAVTGGVVERARIAALARPVLELAGAGDPVAGRIVAEAAEALERLVLGTASAAPWLADDERSVVFGGGVLSPASPVAGALASRLARSLPGFAVIRSELPPAAGAYFLALRSCGVGVDAAMLASVREQFRSRSIQAGKNSPHHDNPATKES